MVDLTLSRPDVDPERIALLGYSFGGHLVLRAAAYEMRIKALLANSPILDFGKQMLDGFPSFATRTSDRVANLLMDNSIGFMSHPLQASMKRLYESMRVTRFSDFRREMARYRFDEIEKITCPVLCMISDGEGISAVNESRRVYERLSNPQKSMATFSAAEGADVHCQLNNLAVSVCKMADWLDEIWQ